MSEKQSFSLESYNLFTKSDLSVGVLGGTFDPPHIAHLILAENIINSMKLDAVIFMVAFNPWQKSGKFEDYSHRLQMVKLSIAGNNKFFYSEVEKELGSESSTFKTAQYLFDKYPNFNFKFIVGLDAANGLHTWKNADLLKKSCEFIFVNRPGVELKVDSDWNYTLVDSIDIDISSTEIKSLISGGESIKYLVIDEVEEYIKSNGLYKSI